jgi:hypothetical protein
MGYTIKLFKNNKKIREAKFPKLWDLRKMHHEWIQSCRLEENAKNVYYVEILPDAKNE